MDHALKQRHAEWLKGQPAAIAFIESLFDALHVWDDLTDRDTPLMTEAIHRAFWDLLIALPRNQFYAQNFALLNGILQQAMLNWHIANKMETTGEELDKQIAFILRSSYVDLVTACAWVLGGEKWAIQVGYEARHQTSGEGYATYCERLLTEHRTTVLTEGDPHGML